MTHKLNHTGNVAVSTDRHWMAVTDTAPPVGVKCNLLTRYGVAIIGTVHGAQEPWNPRTDNEQAFELAMLVASTPNTTAEQPARAGEQR